MTIGKGSDWTSGQIICLYLFTISAALSAFVFWVARNDHDMKLIAIGGVLGFVSGSSGTAATILTGRPVSSGNKLPSPDELAPGGSASVTESVQAPQAEK
jgi:hypothetical protein